MELPFTLVAGHVLCEMDGKRVLVDTGSPFTIGRERTVRFFGSLADITPPGPVPSADDIAAAIRALPEAPAEFDFDVLLGCDLLAGCVMDVDWERSVLSIQPSPAGTLLPSAAEATRRLPRIYFEVNGHGFRAYADTGARVSYVLREHVDDCVQHGTARDFLMGLGAFDARLVTARVTLSGHSWDGIIGVAGSDLEPLLRGTGVDGIVGTDLMSRCGKTRFLFGNTAGQEDDVAAPDHDHLLPLGLADGALIVRANAGPEMYMPRSGPDDGVSDTMLTLGVLGMVIGDRELFGQLAERFVRGMSSADEEKS